jgi:hypothetical protein
MDWGDYGGRWYRVESSDDKAVAGIWSMLVYGDRYR